MNRLDLQWRLFSPTFDPDRVRWFWHHIDNEGFTQYEGVLRISHTVSENHLADEQGKCHRAFSLYSVNLHPAAGVGCRTFKRHRRDFQTVDRDCVSYDNERFPPCTRGVFNSS